MGLFSGDLETVPEVIEELNEITGIYKAVLERETNPKIVYLSRCLFQSLTEEKDATTTETRVLH